MQPVCWCGGILLVQAVEFWVDVELMFGAHSVTVSWNDLSVVLDGANDVGESIDFSKVLFWGFLDIGVFILISLRFCLSLLPFLSFLGRWRFLPSITLNINQHLIRISTEQLSIKPGTETIMLDQQIRHFPELKIAQPTNNPKNYP